MACFVILVAFRFRLHFVCLDTLSNQSERGMSLFDSHQLILHRQRRELSEVTCHEDCERAQSAVSLARRLTLGINMVVPKLEPSLVMISLGMSR